MTEKLKIKKINNKMPVTMDVTFTHTLGVVRLDLCDHFIPFISLVSVCPRVLLVPRVECGQVCR